MRDCAHQTAHRLRAFLLHEDERSTGEARPAYGWRGSKEGAPPLPLEGEQRVEEDTKRDDPSGLPLTLQYVAKLGVPPEAGRPFTDNGMTIHTARRWMLSKR